MIEETLADKASSLLRNSLVNLFRYRNSIAYFEARHLLQQNDEGLLCTACGIARGEEINTTPMEADVTCELCKTVIGLK